MVNRVRTSLVRRRLIVSMGASTLASSALRMMASAEISPGQRTKAINAVHVGAPTTIKENLGDTWIPVWADDDNLYTPSNDTAGFGNDPFSTIVTDDQRRRFARDPEGLLKALTPDQQKILQDSFGTIAFNRLQGNDPLKLSGNTVNQMPEFVAQDRAKQDPPGVWVGMDGRTWKSSGCTSIDGTLYWVIARHNYGDPFGKVCLRQTAADASIIKSNDFGRTWIRSAEENLTRPMFPGSQFATPYFVDYGKTPIPVDGADRYIYAISNNGFWDNGDRLIIGRVLRTRIGRLDGSDWEFFIGGDGLRDTSWSRDATAAKAIVENPQKLGETGAVYLSSRQRYMMVAWYYPSCSGHFKGASTKTVWDFYEAPKPWGPWTHIASHTWAPQGYYTPAICPKFQSADKVYVFTAGDFNNPEDFYHLTVVPIDLR